MLRSRLITNHSASSEVGQDISVRIRTIVVTLGAHTLCMNARTSKSTPPAVLSGSQ